MKLPTLEIREYVFYPCLQKPPDPPFLEPHSVLTHRQCGMVFKQQKVLHCCSCVCHTKN